MDGKRFDEIATELAHGASRRAVVKGLAGGGLAALLAALGLGPEEAGAASCKRTCRKFSGRRRKRCLRRCNNRRNGAPIGPGGPTLQPYLTAGDCTTGTCVGGFCQIECTVSTECPTGNCAGGVSQDCPPTRVCGNGEVCCVSGTVCADLGCLAPA